MAFTPNHLSQRDPRWKAEQLGSDNTITVGTDGCALTCPTMLVNGYGFNRQGLNGREPGGQTGWTAAWYVH